MASGIKADDEVSRVFEDQKLKKTQKNIVYKIKDKKIVVDKSQQWPQDWEQFTAVLPPEEGLYSTFDFEYVTANGLPNRALVFLVWAPDTAKVNVKMLYASSKEAIKKQLNGIACEIQGNDQSDVTHEAVLAKVKQNKTN